MFQTTPRGFQDVFRKYSRPKESKQIVTNINEVRISCRKGNQKTLPSMAVVSIQMHNGPPDK